MPISELIFFVTSRCDLLCSTCFYFRELHNGRHEMDLAEIERISSSLGKLSRLYLSGGEPTLRKDLAEICHIFYINNGVRKFILPSNGIVPERTVERIEQVLSFCDDIELVTVLSLDGLEKTHDGMKGKNGSFRSIMETVSGLNKFKKRYNGLRTYIATVVSTQNYPEIKDLSNFIWEELDVDDHGPSPIRGTPKDADLFPPSGDDWRELANCLRPRAIQYWEKSKFSNQVKKEALYRLDDLNRAYEFILKTEKMPFLCAAGEEIGVLEADGRVRLCELTKAVGNVRLNDYNFSRIWDSPLSEEVRKQKQNCACTHACFLNPKLNNRSK